MGGFHQKKLFANVFLPFRLAPFRPRRRKEQQEQWGQVEIRRQCVPWPFFFGVSSVRCKASLMKLVEWKILDNTGYERMVVKVNITRAILDGYFLSFSHFSHYSYKYHKPWLLDLPTYTRSILDG